MLVIVQDGLDSEKCWKFDQNSSNINQIRSIYQFRSYMTEICIVEQQGVNPLRFDYFGVFPKFIWHVHIHEEASAWNFIMILTSYIDGQATNLTTFLC